MPTSTIFSNIRPRLRQWLVAVVVIVVLLGIFIWWSIATLYTPVALANPAAVRVAKGDAITAIATQLKDKKIFTHPWLFVVAATVQGNRTRLQAGDYLFTSHDTAATILSRIASGDTEHDALRLTVVEGTTRADIIALLHAKNFAAAGAFATRTKDAALWKNEYAFLADVPKNQTLEGYLFPDTYFIAKDAPADVLVKKMLDNFERKLGAHIVGTDTLNLHEVLTLASIVEKEVPKDADRKLVADVFLKRMQIGQKLQSDVTVLYGLPAGTTEPTRKDLDTITPYNTYAIAGLPVGPICNPSLSAINAVFAPTANDYYYFLTDTDGAVHYGRTLEEHNQNRAMYLGK